MEQKRLCPFCIGELPPAATVCPHCGKILEGCNPAGCLPVGTVLAGRYTVGEMRSLDGEGVLYSGVENLGGFRVTIKEYLPVTLSAERGADCVLRPKQGTYYLAVNASYDTTGTYSFKTSFQSAGESFTESGNGTNNSLQNANSISIGSKYTGQIAENDEKDIYKLTLNTSKKLTLSYSSRLEDAELYIYDRDGKVVWNEYSSKDRESGLNIKKEQISLSAGTYYFVVDKRWSSTGPYTFGFYQYTSISSASITLGSQRYVYDGYAKKPKVTVKYKSKVLKNGKDYTVSYSSNKYVGTAKVKITGKGSFNGSKTQTFVIVPKATKIKKLKGQKNGFIIQIVPQKTQTTAYEMQCSTNSKFKKASRYVISNKYKKVSIKTLKRKKKYYVRIRTYKTKGEWNYLSSWSPVKTVKTK